MKQKYTLLLLLALFGFHLNSYSQGQCTEVATNVQVTEVNTGLQKGIVVSWDPNPMNIGYSTYKIIMEFTITNPHTFDTIDVGTSPSRFIPYEELCNGNYIITIITYCPSNPVPGPPSTPVSITVLSEEACYISTTLCPGIELPKEDIDILSGLGKVDIDCHKRTYTIRPDIKVVGQGITGYKVEKIPYSPPYPLTEGEDVGLDSDDKYSGITYLPFKFCFYDSVYDQLLMAPNGYLSFNTQYANQQCGWNLRGYQDLPQQNFGGTYNWRNAIYGVFEDIHPGVAVSTGTGSFKYGIRGEAPCRVFINSYFDIPLFSHTTLRQSYQIVLYEGTNIIDVYVAKRNYPPTWNDGRGVIGVQNADGTKATCPPGRNLTDRWSTFDNTGQNVPEAWRFTPINETRAYEVTWTDGEGNLLGKGDSLVVDCHTWVRKTVIATLEGESCNGHRYTYRDTTIFAFNKPEIVQNVEICQMESYNENGWNIPMQKRTGEFEFFRTKSGDIDNYCGCDTVFTLKLKVNSRPNTDTTVMACPGDTVWLNNKFSVEKGYMLDTLVASSGCDSIVVMNVKRFPEVGAKLDSSPEWACADDPDYTITMYEEPDAITPTKYVILYDDKAKAAGFVDSDTLPYDTITRQIVFELPDSVYPDTYCATVLFVDSVNDCPGSSFIQCFDVYYPDTIMNQKWDDVVAVKNKFYNGGFDIAGCQWYKYENGTWVMMPGENKSVLQHGVQKGNQYMLEVTRPDGTKMMTCPITITDGRPENPTVIVMGGLINIFVKSGGSIVNVWTSDGILMRTGTYNQQNYQINTPERPGTYIIEVTTDKGGKTAKPIVVSRH